MGFYFFAVQLVVIFLKVTQTVAWSWSQVFTPSYVLVGIFIYKFTLMVLAYGLVESVKEILKENKT